MEKAGAAILQQVREHPEKGRDIRKFVTYYLPTAVKILTTYAAVSYTHLDVYKRQGYLKAAAAYWEGRSTKEALAAAVGDRSYSTGPVSYTHLDVYKRQVISSALKSSSVAEMFLNTTCAPCSCGISVI